MIWENLSIKKTNNSRRIKNINYSDLGIEENTRGSKNDSYVYDI